MMLKEERRAAAGLGLAISLLLLVAGASYFALVRHRAAVALVQSCNDTIYGLERVLSLLKDSETAGRGYIVTGDESYLAPHTQAIAAMEHELLALSGVPRPAGIRPAEMARLKQLAKDKLEAVSRVIDIRRRDDQGELAAAIRESRGKHIMDVARSVCAALDAEQRGLLVTARAEADRAAGISTLIVVGGSTMLFLCLVNAARVITRDLGRRRAAERALAAGEVRFRTTLASIDDGVIATDERGNLTFVNAMARTLTGLSDQWAGTPLVDAVRIEVEGTGERWDPVRKALEDGTSTTGPSAARRHMVIARADGVRIPVEDSCAPIRGADGEITGAVLVLRDDRERRRAEAELAALASDNALALALLDGLFANAPIGFAFFDRERRVLRLNDWFARLVGVPPADQAGRSIGDFAPGAAAAMGPLIDRVFSTSESLVNSEISLETAAQPGVRRSWLTGYYPVQPRPGGSVELVGAVVVEITDRKEAEEALRASQHRLNLVIDSIGLGMWYSDLPAGRMRSNDLFRAHLGFAADQAIDPDSLYSRVHPDDRERVRRAIQTSIATGSLFDVDCRIATDDLEGRWIRAIGRPMVNTSGRAASFDGITMDITERMRGQAERALLLDRERQARGEAERISRVKDEFVATLSHELRTPLNAILGWAQLLRGKPSDLATVSRGLEVIERNSRVQVRMIDDLLDMSRIISGKLRLDVQRVSLAGIIEDAIEAIRPAAEAKGVALRGIVDPGVGTTHGDPNRLQQIIWNLLSNAIKFTPRGGKVHVMVHRVNSHTEIVVSDTGMGISPDFLPHVFERFKQADATTTRRFGGLGLGLSIVRHLVELHGGTVSVRSEGADKGATFTVSLPVTPIRAGTVEQDREHPRVERALPGGTGDIPLDGIRVLVVDDEPDARELLRRVLEGRGAQVLLAGSALEALERLEGDAPDVLVSDIGMPDIDGYELIRRVRARGPGSGASIPAAALTAFARSEDRTRAMLAGYQVHMAKPVEPAELVAVVATLARPRAG